MLVALLARVSAPAANNVTHLAVGTLCSPRTDGCTALPVKSATPGTDRLTSSNGSCTLIFPLTKNHQKLTTCITSFKSTHVSHVILNDVGCLHILVMHDGVLEEMSILSAKQSGSV